MMHHCATGFVFFLGTNADQCLKNQLISTAKIRLVPLGSWRRISRAATDRKGRCATCCAIVLFIVQTWSNLITWNRMKQDETGASYSIFQNPRVLTFRTYVLRCSKDHLPRCSNTLIQLLTHQENPAPWRWLAVPWSPWETEAVPGLRTESSWKSWGLLQTYYHLWFIHDISYHFMILASLHLYIYISVYYIGTTKPYLELASKAISWHPNRP